MYILKKIPDEDMFIDFDEYLDLDETKLIICGNRHFRNIGDKKLISIVEGNYYDEEAEYEYETLEELKKVTGKVWDTHTMRGYCQGDWNILYYVVDEVDEDEIELIENFYMGKVTEFEIDDDGECYHDYCPDDVVWKGKKSICEYFGIKEEETTIYEDDGYEKVYRYKEVK